MVDAITYREHLKVLNQIKNRNNQYPTFQVKDTKQNNKKIIHNKICGLKAEIDKNNKNIESIKNELNMKKKINKNKEIPVYLKDIDDMKRQMLDGLINKNEKLKYKLKELKSSNEILSNKYN